MRTFALCVLLAFSWGLAFFAGLRSAPKLSFEKLEVVFVDENGRPDVPAELQVLALIAADPRKDADVAFWAKDFRLVVCPGPGTHASPEVKMIPLGNDVIRHPSQAKVNHLVGEYAHGYNERMKELTKWDEDIRRMRRDGVPPSLSK